MPRPVNRTFLLGAAGAGAALLAAVCLPPGRSLAREGKSAASRPPVSPASSAPFTEETKAEPVPFDHYRPLLQRNPFAPRLPKKPTVTSPRPDAPSLPDVTVQVKPADKKPEDKKAETPKPPEPLDPLKDWIYSGTVAIGGDVYAVVENKPGKQSQYVKKGDTLQGFTVENVAQSELGLRQNGTPRRLAKSSAFNATPLSGGGPAAGGPAPGGPPKGGAPGAPTAAPGPAGPGRAGGPVRQRGPSPAPTTDAPTSAPALAAPTLTPAAPNPQ